MKTSFHAEYKLQDDYFELLPGQSGTLNKDILSQVHGINLTDIFEIISSLTVETGFTHSLFGISDARTALIVSYFVGLGSFMGFVSLIALFRGIYLLIKNKRRRRAMNDDEHEHEHEHADSFDNEHYDPSISKYVVKSDRSLKTGNSSSSVYGSYNI